MTIYVPALSAVDQLTEALVLLRPNLHQRLSVVERAHNFWAIAVAVRELGAVDVVAQDLIKLARDSGLMESLNGGADDVAHLIQWGLLNRDPFY